MSDWSSDVCSSDLLGASRPELGYAPRGRCKRGRSVAERHHQTLERVVLDEAVPGGRHCRDDVLGELVDADPPERTDQPAGDRGVTAIPEIGRAHSWTPVTNEQLVCRHLLEK